MVKVAHFLYFTIESSPSLIQTDFDLLLDSLVLCWEVSKHVLSRVTSHDQQASKLFLKHSTGNQVYFMIFLHNCTGLERLIITSKMKTSQKF